MLLLPYRMPPPTDCAVPFEPGCTDVTMGAAVAALISLIAALYTDVKFCTAFTSCVVLCATVTVNGVLVLLCKLSAMPGIADVTVFELLKYLDVVASGLRMSTSAWLPIFTVAPLAAVNPAAVRKL